MRDFSLQHAGSSLRHAGFSPVVACRFSLSSCGARAPGYVGSVVCGMQSLLLRCTSSVVVVRGLSCIGRWILYHWTTREVPNFCLKLLLELLNKRKILTWPNLAYSLFLSKSNQYQPLNLHCYIVHFWSVLSCQSLCNGSHAIKFTEQKNDLMATSYFSHTLSLLW